MDIQAVFYALGSFFLILGIVVMFGLLFIMWKAYEAIEKTKQTVEGMRDDVVGKVTEFVSSKPSLIASSVGMGLSSMIIKKVKGMFNGK